MTDQQIETLSNDKDVADTKISESEKMLMKEWEQHMSDFIPEDISTVEVEARHEMVRVAVGFMFR